MLMRPHLSGGTRVRKLLLTTAAVLAMGGFVASAHARGVPTGTTVIGSGTSVGLGFSQSGSGTNGSSHTSSGTTYGGSGSTSNGAAATR